MNELREYRRRPGTTVTAVKLDLDTEGFTYRKWGGLQRCRAGDWIVEGGRGGVHTVAGHVFERTYRRVRQGVYEKVGAVWAERASEAGAIKTLEGETRYEAGYWLVYNDPDREDGWAMSDETFQSTYEPVG